MENSPQLNKRRITFLVLGFSLVMIMTGFFVNTPEEVLQGEWVIITSPSILITDYIALASLGSALFNVGLVTLAGLALAWLIDASFNGYFLAGIFTMAGFAFFGKNPFNILPIFAGVYLFHRFSQQQRMKDLIAPLLFGTTLGPVVSQIAFGFGLGWKGLVAGILVGIFSGMLLAALMRHIYNLHLGYNLYNIGTTGGFVALVIFMFLKGFGFNIQPQFHWSTEYTDFLSWLTLTFLILIILLGIYWGGRMAAWKIILNSSGRLPSDFVERVDLGTVLVNMGFIGLIALGYIHFVGGDVNGATLAGVFTVFGFGALGKHPRNILPVILGVYLICFFKIWTHAEPGPLLAALFCTTLAPLAGRFGVLAGIAAGALHLPMVMHVGSIHGYMNLYNNGFAGGLVMLIIVGFIKSLWPQLLEE
ncbi:MAG: DUF1576 domain-containing protein [Anaerolineaceae bacterium]|jgi:hypothetical protein|nr:DUF1576 domain-containing protein [Anaerolineaceae bacterium]